MGEFLVGPDLGYQNADGSREPYLSWYEDDFKPQVINAKTPAAAARAYVKSKGHPEDGIVVQALHDPLTFTSSETVSVSVKPR